MSHLALSIKKMVPRLQRHRRRSLNPSPINLELHNSHLELLLKVGGQSLNLFPKAHYVIHIPEAALSGAFSNQSRVPISNCLPAEIFFFPFLLLVNKNLSVE